MLGANTFTHQISSCYAALAAVADTAWDLCLMLVTANTPPAVAHGVTETSSITGIELMGTRLSLERSKIILKTHFSECCFLITGSMRSCVWWKVIINLCLNNFSETLANSVQLSGSLESWYCPQTFLQILLAVLCTTLLWPEHFQMWSCKQKCWLCWFP